jgi:hypothetical protein
MPASIIIPPQWRLQPSAQFSHIAKWYEKKHPNELTAILNNTTRYLSLLNACKNAAVAQAGYLHHEPCGVKAIDQKGGGRNLQETRLYTYADDTTRILHLITIGNKDEQPSDIEFSKQFVKDNFRQE